MTHLTAGEGGVAILNARKVSVLLCHSKRHGSPRCGSVLGATLARARFLRVVSLSAEKQITIEDGCVALLCRTCRAVTIYEVLS